MHLHVAINFNKYHPIKLKKMKVAKPAVPAKKTGKQMSATKSKVASSKTEDMEDQDKEQDDAENQDDEKSEHRENLEKIFEDTLKDMYWAEKHLSKALPKMAKSANDKGLKDAYMMHAEQTKGHIERIEKAFASINKKASPKKCEAMEGLVKEGEEAIEEYDKSSGRDAALIVASQKVEHYEISGYGSLHSFATLLGYTECVDLFAQTLQEEKDTDVKLSDLSDSINQQALAA